MADGSLFGRVRGPVIIDLFAGGGGASLGLKWATGVEPVVAINHCEHAIRMHTANHPLTEHYHASVFDVAPLAASRGRSVDLLWASPDCTDHSRAKGGKPREKGKRALAWVIVDWAREVRPRIIAIENVEEFSQWGPLYPDDYPVAKLRRTPIPERRGELYREWVSALEAQGYTVEWRLLRAADYGVPTTRRRFFLVARCDGLPIVWPAPTHGKDAWRWAADCVEWNEPMCSIFATPEEAKAWGREHGRGTPNRPLAENTMARIAEGVKRYVLDTPTPFLLHLTHGGRLHRMDQPMPTVTGAHRGEMAVVAPSILNLSHGGRPAPLDVPLATITATPKGGDRALLAAALINTRNGERKGQAPRCRDLRRPLPTVTAEGSQGGLVAALLSKHYGGVVGQGLDRPIGTVTGIDHHSLTAVWLDKLHGSARAGIPIDEPVPTVTGGGGRGGGHAALCAAFLMRYFGQGGQWSGCRDPMPTVTAREGLALVTTTIAGETWAVADIFMRMLTPRELARAQGFPDDYILIGTKGEQIERIGNSVVPQLAQAIAAANLGAPC